MARIVWGASAHKKYENGVDRGVLYVKGAAAGVPWDGLISVSEKPSGAEPTPIYADNVKFLNLISAEDFTASLEAITYPDEFAECDGSKEIDGISGLFAGQQSRKAFDLCYRTMIGTNESDSAGYKLHLIYNALAAPTEKTYNTINDSPENATFSWELSTTPVDIGEDGYKPTAILTIDSTKVSKEKLEALEALLYGDAEAATMPTPTKVIETLKEVTQG